jgi:glycogen synthase
VRILHLAYEDPRQPGSGGGSVRTSEINRIIGERHDITALVSSYPGAVAREEDGVSWVPIGRPLRGRAARLAYFAALRHEVRSRPHDLVVEDFGAPFSVGGAPVFTNAPVIASVQWLFAAQMREKYRLPFDWVERWGLRRYDRFICVSEWLARDVRARRPDAEIETIPNGVDRLALAPREAAPAHLLFVGRLDREQKGVDLLMLALARAVVLLDGEPLPPVVVAGDGPYRVQAQELAASLGLAERVRFAGRVEGDAKYRLMADAYATLMPSRWETFGMVAVEALAAGSSLITFDVGPLAEVAAAGAVRLVPPFDVDQFAAAIVDRIRLGGASTAERETGRRWARTFAWETMAARQESYYLRVVGDASPERGRDLVGALSA